MSEIALLLQGGLFLVALLTFVVVLIDKLKNNNPPMPIECGLSRL